MNSIKNKVQLIGNLGTDPEMFTFEGGNKKASFSLATNGSYTNKAGEKVEETQWHNIIFYGKTAEIAEKFLNKGNEIAIEGKLTTRSYDKDGEKRYVTEIIGNELLMMGKKE